VTLLRIRLALAVYGALTGLAFLWGALAGRIDLYHHPEPWLRMPFPASTGVAVLLGLAVALVVVASTRVLVRRTTWARRLHGDFRALFGPLAGRDIIVFALTSGVAEELFFRGALDPSLGLVGASLVFGAIHIGPSRRFWVWTLWATAMGLVFGALYRLTGELIAPMVAHIAINYENMHFIEAYDPSPPGAGAPLREATDPRLVSTRIRSGAKAP